MKNKSLTIGKRSPSPQATTPPPRRRKLAESAPVPAAPLTALRTDPPFLKGMLKLSKPRSWPADYPLNHRHHVKGTSKK